MVDPRYWSNAARALAGSLREREFRRRWLSAGLEETLRAPEVSILDLYPELANLPVEMGSVTYRQSNVDPMEQYCLRAILQLIEPALVFEIGTFDGATTLAMAQAAPRAEIVTLDLPPERSEVAQGEEARNVALGVGHRFEGAPEADRITQVLGDSRTFDYRRWQSSVDLVLVDAGHDYELAAADTASALRLVRPGGVIVWDDYDLGWPGVVRAVEETDLPVVHLVHTGMAVLRTEPQA